MAVAVCPMCHVANNAENRECRDCGYTFGQSVEALRGLLRSQKRWSLLLFVGLLALDVGVLFGLALLPVLVVVAPLVTTAWFTYRALNKFLIARHSLKLLAAKEDAVPKARLLSK
jgi:hypothetical protein